MTDKDIGNSIIIGEPCAINDKIHILYREVIGQMTPDMKETLEIAVIFEDTRGKHNRLLGRYLLSNTH